MRPASPFLFVALVAACTAGTAAVVATRPEPEPTFPEAPASQRGRVVQLSSPVSDSLYRYALSWTPSPGRGANTVVASEWALFAKRVVYRAGKWHREPEYTVVARGRTGPGSQSFAVDVRAPSVTDTLYVHQGHREIDRRGRVSSWYVVPDDTVVGVPDSLAIYRWSPADTTWILRTPPVGVPFDTLEIAQKTELCWRMFAADTLAMQSCPMRARVLTSDSAGALLRDLPPLPERGSRAL